MAIKNVVFDIGNVLVQWNPLKITTQFFPEYPDPETLTQQLFKSITWFDLNKGKLSEQAAILIYHQQLNIPIARLEQLMQAIKESLIPVPGSFALLEQLFRTHIPLYALTDNTHEIIAYLQKTYHFWSMFKGIIVSADIGNLKPSPIIYQQLLLTYQLVPEETLFIDDLQLNVAGAQAVGIQAFRFESANQCFNELRNHHLI